MIESTKQGWIQGSSKSLWTPPPLASDRPLMSLDKLLKMLVKLKSAHNKILYKTVTVTSLTGNYVILH